MNSTTIAQVLAMPDKSHLDCVQGTITEVYKSRQVAGKSVQDAKLKDGSGEIKLTLWDRPDHSMYKGRDVIIQAGPKGGLTVKFDGYQNKNVNTISVSAGCTFQFLEVHKAQTGTAAGSVASGAAVSQSSASSTSGASSNTGGCTPIVVNGAKVGMCVNNAVLFMTTAGEAFDADKLFQIASEILKVSVRLENGETK